MFLFAGLLLGQVDFVIFYCLKLPGLDGRSRAVRISRYREKCRHLGFSRSSKTLTEFLLLDLSSPKRGTSNRQLLRSNRFANFLSRHFLPRLYRPRINSHRRQHLQQGVTFGQRQARLLLLELVGHGEA